MRMRTAILAAIFWAGSALPAFPQEPQAVIHGDARVQRSASGAVFEVESALAQVRLSDSLVATAANGASFEIFRTLSGSNSEILHVTRGSVVVIDEIGNRALTLTAGGRLSFPAARAASSTTPDQAPLTDSRMLASSSERDDTFNQWQFQEARQGFLLSDSVMTRQQEYLASLKIDVVDLNRALASFIRRLFF